MRERGIDGVSVADLMSAAGQLVSDSGLGG
jgi:hypothetical protein